jgi:tetratricopeptide (TPR) repeat protein
MAAKARHARQDPPRRWPWPSTEPEEEIRAYTEALRLNPTLSVAYSNRGVARQEKGDLDGALQDYEEALRLRPDYDLASHNRERLLKTLNKKR